MVQVAIVGFSVGFLLLVSSCMSAVSVDSVAPVRHDDSSSRVVTTPPANVTFATEVSTPLPGVEVSPYDVVRIVELRGASPGGGAQMTVQTAPHLTCSVRYVNPIGTIVSPSGLEPKTANDVGRVSWMWMIDPATPTGVGRVQVTCSNGLGDHQYIKIGD